jgi:hypothetical protein
MCVVLFVIESVIVFDSFFAFAPLCGSVVSIALASTQHRVKNFVCCCNLNIVACAHGVRIGNKNKLLIQ